MSSGSDTLHLNCVKYSRKIKNKYAHGDVCFVQMTAFLLRQVYDGFFNSSSTEINQVAPERSDHAYSGEPQEDFLGPSL